MIKAGQRLREERLRQGLSLEQVAKATKIRESFLEHIEKSQYEKLPSSAYAQGFVKNYAQFLGLSSKEVLALFRREFNEHEYLKVLPEGFAKREDISLSGFRFGRQLFLGVCVLIILIFYIAFQYRYAFLTPPLSVATPFEEEQVGNRILVSGKTDPSATIMVNEFPVSVNNDGSFKKTISIFEGKATVTIKAQNRFGKQTIIERHIEVK